eukprot:Gb_19499 [translate_table: standard]
MWLPLLAIRPPNPHCSSTVATSIGGSATYYVFSSSFSLRLACRLLLLPTGPAIHGSSSSWQSRSLHFQGFSLFCSSASCLLSLATSFKRLLAFSPFVHPPFGSIALSSLLGMILVVSHCSPSFLSAP